jgi:hypothetical protein
MKIFDSTENVLISLDINHLKFPATIGTNHHFRIIPIESFYFWSPASLVYSSLRLSFLG